MACKLPTVAFHNKKFPIFTADDYFPPEYPFIGTSEDEILNYCGELIKHPQLRRKWGDDLYKHYTQEFSDKKIHESLCNIISTELDTSVIKNHIATEIDYDIEYSPDYMGSKMDIYKNLLLQSLSKRSTFSFKERIDFYSKALKMNEIKSKNFAFMYAIFSVIGWRGVSILNKMYRNNQ